MDIDLVRTFLEVERLRHFGKASNELFVTQAAVSARVKSLEGLLGVSLFSRQSRQIELTPEGHRFKRYAERFIADWRKARHDVAMGSGKEQLALGGTWRVWDAGLQEWLHDVYTKYPHLALIVESHTPDTLVRRLLDGQLDVGFILEPPQIEALEIVEVALLKLVMVSNKPDVSLEQALNEQFIMVDWGLGQALQQRRLYPDAPEPYLRIAQAGIAMDFIKQFGGAAYLSTRMVHDAVKLGELFPVKGAEPIERMVHGIHSVRSERLELIEKVIEQFEYRVSLPRRSKVVK